MAAASMDSNIVLRYPIDLSFDLDEVLTTTNAFLVPETPKDSTPAITAASSDAFVSDLPTVATAGVCTVCMEDFQTEFPGKQVPCGHVFHASCIAKWVSLCNSCPLCRSRCIISTEEVTGNSSM